MNTTTTRIAAWIVLGCFSGCATTATIARTDGPDNEADIVRSDESALYVRGSNGRIYRLDRASVADIDHPGNVNMMVGAALLGLFALTMSALDANERRDAIKPLGLVYGLPGLGLFSFGTYAYVRSVYAARAFTVGPSYEFSVPREHVDRAWPQQQEQPRARPQPQPQPDDGSPLVTRRPHRRWDDPGALSAPKAPGQPAPARAVPAAAAAPASDATGQRSLPADTTQAAPVTAEPPPPAAPAEPTGEAPSM